MTPRTLQLLTSCPARHFVAACLAGVMVFIVGCNTTRETSTPDGGTAPQPLAPQELTPTWRVLGEPEEAGEPVSWVDLHPFVTDMERWYVLSGTDEGTVITRRRGPTDLHDATWMADLGDGDVHFLVRSSTGGVAMTAVEAHRDKALSLFEPVLGVAPETLTPGTTYSTQARMTVTDISDPSKVTQRGRATRSLTHLGSVEVEINGVTRRVQALRMVFLANLDLAKARTETRLYVVPGEGVIASETTHQVKALLFSRTSGQTIVRMGPALDTTPVPAVAVGMNPDGHRPGAP